MQLHPSNGRSVACPIWYCFTNTHTYTPEFFYVQYPHVISTDVAL